VLALLPPPSTQTQLYAGMALEASGNLLCCDFPPSTAAPAPPPSYRPGHPSNQSMNATTQENEGNIKSQVRMRVVYNHRLG